MWKQFLWPILAAVVLAGCSAGGPLGNPDEKAEIDDAVEEDIAEFEERKAVEFLAAGGKHYQDPQNPANTFDKDVMLPLCQRLESEFNLKPIAIVDQDENGKDYIYEIAVKVPSDPVTRASIKEAISQADAQFVGRISAEWGHKWLSLILEPPTELE